MLLLTLGKSYADCLSHSCALLCDPVYYGFGVPRGRGEPVLLIPGFFAGDYSIAPLGQWLARIGYRPYLSGIDWNIGCPGRRLERLKRRVEMIVREEARPPVIIGHSLGGLLARSLAASSPVLVSHVIGLGAPVSVGRAALRTEFRLALRAAEALLDVLTNASPRCATAECGCALNGRSRFDAVECGYSAIFSRRDEVVEWRTCVDPRGDNHEVSGGHRSLIVNAQVYRRLALILARQRSASPLPG
jgi:pimeloyl-ACP methyl ester carboxylesterase